MTALIFALIKENFVAEQGARMVAMDGASKNAAEMIEKMTLAFNRLRQAVSTINLTARPTRWSSLTVSRIHGSGPMRVSRVALNPTSSFLFVLFCSNQPVLDYCQIKTVRESWLGHDRYNPDVLAQALDRD